MAQPYSREFGMIRAGDPRLGIYNAIPTSEPEVIDTSMYGADQNIYGVENARGLFRPSVQSTNFNTKYGSDGITYYERDEEPDLDEEMGRLYDIQPYSRMDGMPRMDGILSTLKDYGKDIVGRSIASQALANAGAMAGGLPLALAGLVYGGIKGGDLFNAPYIGAGAATVDEFGRMYSAEQLDKLNAAGGYYSDPARSSRRRDARIRNMIERRDAGLKIGLNNLAKLQEQQRREESARQSAADAMRDSNRANRTGGYQSSMRDDTGFMEGPDTSKGESFSSVQGST